MNEIVLWVYRDFGNRRAGEPDDGPLAWKAHRERQAAMREVLEVQGIPARWSPEALDSGRPHELAEFVVSVVKDPSVGVALTAAGIYLAKVLAGRIDDLAGKLLSRVSGAMVDRFRKRRIGDFWITASDGTKISVPPDGVALVTFRDGKVVSFDVDSPGVPPPGGGVGAGGP